MCGIHEVEINNKFSPHNRWTADKYQNASKSVSVNCMYIMRNYSIKPKTKYKCHEFCFLTCHLDRHTGVKGASLWPVLWFTVIMRTFRTNTNLGVCQTKRWFYLHKYKTTSLVTPLPGWCLCIIFSKNGSQGYQICNSEDFLWCAIEGVVGIYARAAWTRLKKLSL